MHIIGFEARANAKGEAKHWVHYAPNAVEMNSVAVWAPIAHVKPRDPEPRQEVTERWEQFFGPAYEAWLQGMDIPEHGTPIISWVGLDKSSLAAFRSAGIRTVEEIAEMNDTMMARVPLPNLRGIQSAARKFLELRGVEDLGERMDARERENEALREQIEALSARLDAEKPKRGRPPKVEAA